MSDYDKELDRYLSELVDCPACNKKTARRDWPLVPSTGKPKKTCCRTTGWKQKLDADSRKSVVNGVIYWTCTSCNTPKTEDAFGKSRGKLKSSCKQCHKDRYKDYKSPSEIRRNAQSKIRQMKKNQQLIECKSCGKNVKRKDWPKDESGHLATMCCVETRFPKINKYLKRRGKKFCNACDLVKPLGEFPVVNGKDAAPCKSCKKSNSLKHNSSGIRKDRIVSSDDGTLTPKVVGHLFASADSCPVCFVSMSFEDKTMDHIKPLSLGGTHSLSNAMIMCHKCNTKKQSKEPKKWFDCLSEDSKLSVLKYIDESRYLTRSLLV